MQTLEYRLELLRKILFQAYNQKEKQEVGDRWQVDVMRQIRRLGPLPSQPLPVMQFGQFVWRLTPVTCLLIIMSAAVWLQFDFALDYNLFLSFITSSEEISLAQLLPI